MEQWTIRKVTDADEATALYQSLVGTPYCAWCEAYPTREDALEDIARGSLFGAYDEAGSLCGVVSLTQEDEQRALLPEGMFVRPVGLSRLGVALEKQGRGLGRLLANAAIERARAAGYDGVFLLASPNNIPAVRLYESLKFTKTGECDLYDIHWHIYVLATKE